MCARFAVAPQTAEVMTLECDKCSVKMEKTLTLWMEEKTENVF